MFNKVRVAGIDLNQGYPLEWCCLVLEIRNKVIEIGIRVLKQIHLNNSLVYSYHFEYDVGLLVNVNYTYG